GSTACLPLLPPARPSGRGEGMPALRFAAHSAGETSALPSRGTRPPRLLTRWAVRRLVLGTRPRRSGWPLARRWLAVHATLGPPERRRDGGPLGLRPGAHGGDLAVWWSCRLVPVGSPRAQPPLGERAPLDPNPGRHRCLDDQRRGSDAPARSALSTPPAVHGDRLRLGSSCRAVPLAAHGRCRDSARGKPGGPAGPATPKSPRSPRARG